ncbi:glycosyltransferase [Luteimonas viscosa]|uniref:glycosyltransferase n=1 Tax=Luteimonas viscosa TaxID=1132694 RepID=UPI0016541434|nr:glycosyltransferase [Luteimonas viscosa]
MIAGTASLGSDAGPESAVTLSDVRRAAESARRFTLLLIAYEFPPSPSPQSLRWAYLARELALRGHCVHILAPEHPGAGHGLPELPDGVVVHRTYAGPAMGLLNFLAKRERRKAAGAAAEPPAAVTGPPASASAVPVTAVAAPPLNWKGRLHNAANHCRTIAFHGFQRLTARWFFPDGRAEWYPWAKRRLRFLLDQLDVDLVLSSHEPATTLSLGLDTRRHGLPWIADLGDPVLAPYTPPRWRKRAARLERRVCMAADRVLVTNPAVAALLTERHGVAATRLSVLTQGFDGRMDTFEDRGSVTPPLELLYTGSFYSFRRAEPLLDAVVATPGVRLNIASISVPEHVQAVSRRSPSIRLLGFLPHVEAMAWQRRCDVLVNLANDDPCQVPGKFYEYLGARRPILHIGNGDDAAAKLLLGIPRGWVCPADAVTLQTRLEILRDDARAGRIATSLDLSAAAVREYDWAAIGARLDKIINTLMLEREA